MLEAERTGGLGPVGSVPDPPDRLHPRSGHLVVTSIEDGSWGSQRPSVDVSLHTSLHIPAKCVAAPGHAERRSLVKRHVYRERDYAFAQLVLTLRTAIGLSQAGLAERLGASRRAVAEWEGGLSYPKAERLKQLIELGVRVSAFAAGREEEELRALWKAAHQKVWLDEDWLRDLLAPAAPIPLFPQAQPFVAHTEEEPAVFRR